MEGLLQDLRGVLRLTAITCEALLRCEAALSGFGVFFRGSFVWRHGVFLRFVWVFCGGSLPKRTRHMPFAPVGVECSLCTVPPILPAFFCQPYAVYMRPSGFSHSHTVFCTPH